MGQGEEKIAQNLGVCARQGRVVRTKRVMRGEEGEHLHRGHRGGLVGRGGGWRGDGGKNMQESAIFYL